MKQSVSWVEAGGKPSQLCHVRQHATGCAPRGLLPYAGGSWVEVGTAEQGSFARSSKKTPSDAWLKELGLTQYATAFNTAGYGDWQLLALLDEGDLKAIEKHGHVAILPGHRKKLLLASRQMAQPQDQQLSRTSRRSRVQQLRRASRMSECTSQRVHRTVSQPILPSPSVNRVTPLHMLVMDHTSSPTGSMIRASPPRLPNELLASMEHVPCRCHSLQLAAGPAQSALSGLQAAAPVQIQPTGMQDVVGPVQHQSSGQQAGATVHLEAADMQPQQDQDTAAQPSVDSAACPSVISAAVVTTATAEIAGDDKPSVSVSHTPQMPPALSTLRTASAPHLTVMNMLHTGSNHQGSESFDCSLEHGIAAAHPTGSGITALITPPCGRSVSSCVITMQQVPLLSPTQSHHFPIPDFAAGLLEAASDAADTPTVPVADQSQGHAAVKHVSSSRLLAPDLSIAVAAGTNNSSSQLAVAGRSGSKQGDTTSAEARKARHSLGEASPRLAWLQGQAGSSTPDGQEESAGNDSAEMLLQQSLMPHSRSSPDLSQKQLAGLSDTSGTESPREPKSQELPGTANQQRLASPGHLPPIDLRARPQLIPTPSRLSRTGSVHKSSLPTRTSAGEPMGVPFLLESVAESLKQEVPDSTPAAAEAAASNCHVSGAVLPEPGMDDPVQCADAQLAGDVHLPGRVIDAGQQGSGSPSPWASRVQTATRDGAARAAKDEATKGQQLEVPAARADSEFGVVVATDLLVSASGKLRPSSAPTAAPGASQQQHTGTSDQQHTGKHPAAAVQNLNGEVCAPGLPRIVKATKVVTKKKYLDATVQEQKLPIVQTAANAAAGAAQPGLQPQQAAPESPSLAKPPACSKPPSSRRSKQWVQAVEPGLAVAAPAPLRLPRACKAELQALLQDTASWVVRTSSARSYEGKGGGQHASSSSEGVHTGAAGLGGNHQKEVTTGERLLEKLQAVLLQLAQVTGARLPPDAGCVPATPRQHAAQAADAHSNHDSSAAQPVITSHSSNSGARPSSREQQQACQGSDSVQWQWQQLQHLHGELKARLQQLGCEEAALTSPPRPASGHASSRDHSSTPATATADLIVAQGQSGDTKPQPAATDARKALDDVEARVRAQLAQLAALVRDARSRTPSGRGAAVPEVGDVAAEGNGAVSPEEENRVLGPEGCCGVVLSTVAHAVAVAPATATTGSGATGVQQQKRGNAVSTRVPANGSGDKQHTDGGVLSVLAERKESMRRRKDSSGKQQPKHADEGKPTVGGNTKQQHPAVEDAKQGAQGSVHGSELQARGQTPQPLGGLQMAQTVQETQGPEQVSQHRKQQAPAGKQAGRLAAGQLHAEDPATKQLQGAAAGANHHIGALRSQ